MSDASPTSEAPRLDRDLACVACGYNLRGLNAEKVCPECGVPVGRSLLGDRLECSDPVWLRWQRRGVLAFLLVELCTFVYNITLFWFPLDRYLFPSHREWLHPIWFIEDRISPFVAVFAALCFRAVQRGMAKRSAAQSIIRYGFIAAALSRAALLPVFWDFRKQGLWTTNSIAVSKLIAVWMLALILREFARRGGKPGFGRFIILNGVLDSTMILLNAGLVTYMRLNSPMPFRSPPFYHNLLMVWEYGRAAPMVLSILILYRMNQLFRSALKQSGSPSHLHGPCSSP